MGNPNAYVRPNYKPSVTVNYKSFALGEALFTAMDAFYMLVPRPDAVDFGSGVLTEQSGVLIYTEADKSVSLPISVWMENWTSRYGKLADYNRETVLSFIGRCAVMVFEIDGMLDSLKAWIQLPTGPAQPTSWWRQSGYKSNG